MDQQIDKINEGKEKGILASILGVNNRTGSWSTYSTFTLVSALAPVILAHLGAIYLLSTVHATF